MEAQRTLQGKSMFGSQTLSGRASSASYGFGSSTRGHANRLYIGEGHAKTSVISCTPGPCYDLQGSNGNQADSGKNTPPQWQFGTASRFGSAKRASKNPGPGTYENVSGFGRQGLSNRSTNPLYGFGTVNREMAGKVFISPQHASSSFGRASPGPAAMYQREGGLRGAKYGFGTDERFNRLARELSDAADLPGPGSYDDKGIMGEQTSSRLATEPAFGFGTSNREHISKVFVSDMHARASGSSNMGNFSPSPNAYTLNNGIGVQPTTRGRSAPTWGFGTASRFKDGAYETGSPGPGAYAI